MLNAAPVPPTPNSLTMHHTSPHTIIEVGTQIAR